MEGDVMDKLEDMASVRDFDPLTGSIPATKVELTVSCRNLLDKDTFSKSDPLCVLYTQGIETKQWREEVTAMSAQEEALMMGTFAQKEHSSQTTTQWTTPPKIKNP